MQSTQKPQKEKKWTGAQKSIKWVYMYELILRSELLKTFFGGGSPNQYFKKPSYFYSSSFLLNKFATLA